MDPILLQTKLSIPVRRDALVPRLQLTGRIDRLLQQGYRLALVSAPAGYGKTTLVVDWLHTHLAEPAVRAAWLALEAEENEPIRFLRYLLAALQSADRALGSSAVSLLDGFLHADFSPESILLLLINDLAATDGLFLLVLDDLHVIQNPEVHRLIGFLVDHQPENLRLVIITRSDPPLPLPRLRVRRQLVEIRMVDLRFTPDEAALFLAENIDVPLNSDQIAVLMERTEGWVAGLQLAGAAIQSVTGQGGGDVSEIIASIGGSDRYVLEYLLDEVFRHQPEPVQQFLVSSSILNPLQAGLCDAVLDRTDSAAMLAMLESKNLFITPVDRSRTWFRYHPLFQEFLRARKYPQEERTEMHARASRWYSAHGQNDEALEHALRAGDFLSLAHLIERSRRIILAPGETHRLDRYIQALPDDLRSTRPLILLTRAWMDLLAGQVIELEALIEASLAIEWENPVEVEGEAAAVRALAATLSGNFAQAVAEVDRALAQLPADDEFLRAWLTLYLGISCDAIGQIERAVASYQDALDNGQRLNNHVVVCMAYSELGDIRFRQGDLHRAVEMFQRATEAATIEGRSLPIGAVSCARLGRLYYEWNQLDPAREQFVRALELCRLWEGSDLFLFAQPYLALTCQAQNEPDCAWECIRTAEKALKEGILFSPTVRTFLTLQARLAIRQGNTGGVQTWRKQLTPLTDAPSFVREIEGSTLAWAMLAEGDAAEALNTLEPMLRLAEAEQRTGSLVELLALKAWALAGIGQTVEARGTMRRALQLGEAGGYLRTFVDVGQPLLALIDTALPCPDVSWAYQRALLQAFGREVSRVMPEPVRAAELSEPLSQREVEVLRLISGGKSNQEIARQMVISVSTVKTHINNLFGKMDVKSRTEAVARARELKLLV